MRVPFFDMAAELSPIRAEIDIALARVVDAGHFIGGPEVEAFEQELAVAFRATAAVGVSSGSDALLATLWALEVGPETEVVTTPFTFVATATAAARLGARVVFVDVEPEALTLDPGAALAAITPRTRAIVPVHLFGHPAALPAAVPASVAVIEDAAHSLAAFGVRGRAACCSFFPTKNLGAFGDAGAIVTDDEALAARLRAVRSHGATQRYHHELLGGNFRLDALQAAVLRVKLRRLAEVTARRRVHAQRYRDAFATARVPDELRLLAPHPEHVYHQLVIRAPHRDALRAYLASVGIGTEVYYPAPLHLQPCFAALGYRAGSFPVAEAACREVLALPIHPALRAGAVDEVVAAIERFYQSSARTLLTAK